MIILTAHQAAHVRGDDGQFEGVETALDPRALIDGTFALPEIVLADPAHQEWWTYLLPLPLRDVADGEWLVVE